jgi:hypothetical protein
MRGKRERVDRANGNRRADAQDLSAAGRQRSARLKKVVDFEQACGGTIGLQGNRFPRLQ